MYNACGIRDRAFYVDESSHHNNWPTQQTALDGNPFTESDHPKWLPRLFEPRSSETKIQWSETCSPTLILPREEISLTVFFLRVALVACCNRYSMIFR